MNPFDELQWLLRDRWTPDPNGVDREPVPEPEVLIDGNFSQGDVNNQDFIVVEERAGGDHMRTLKNQKKKVFRMSIRARSTTRVAHGESIDGQTRLYGQFDEATRSQEDYGGLTGEIERIFDEEIDGGPNFDIIIPDSGWAQIESSSVKAWGARLDIDLKVTDHV